VSVTDVDCAAAEGSLCEYPEFDLDAALDDPDDPEAVTVFPRDADDAELATTWLTAGTDDVVPLAEAR